MRKHTRQFLGVSLMLTGIVLRVSFSFGEDALAVNVALLSQGATAACSAYDTATSPSTGDSYSASCDQAIDGITTKQGVNMMNNTFWGVSHKKLPAWIKIQLKNTATLSRIIIKQASVKLTYHIEVSQDDTTWKEVVPSSVYDGPTPTVHTFAPVTAKFVRLTVTDAHVPKDYDDVWAVAIWEVEAYEK